MLSTSRPPTRHAPLPVLRAAVFAVVGTVLGASAHHVVVEGPAPWRQCAVAVAVLFAVGLVGARRPRSLATVVATCAVAQAGLHQWLMTAHPHGTAPMPSMASMTSVASMSMPGHPRHGTDTHAHARWHGRIHDSLTMTAVHAVAAVLVAVLLHRADTVCWSLARGVTTAVEAVRARIATVRAALGNRPVPAETGLPAPVLAWLERPPPEEAALTDVVVRRGPPQAGLTLAN